MQLWINKFTDKKKALTRSRTELGRSRRQRKKNREEIWKTADRAVDIRVIELVEIRCKTIDLGAHSIYISINLVAEQREKNQNTHMRRNQANRDRQQGSERARERIKTEEKQITGRTIVLSEMLKYIEH